MTEANSQAQSGAPRWLYGVLVASLAANLLVIGSAAGAMWAHRHDHHGSERGLMVFVRGLPAEKQASFRETLLAEREKLKPLRETARTSWTETNAVLAEEPFDKEKFKSGLMRTNESEMRVRTAINEALAELAVRLTPDERKALKEWREHRAKGWRKHRWGRDHE